VALGNFALRFDTDATVAVCGAEVATSLDGEPFGLWESRRVERGSELRMVFAQGPGFRMYVALAGGVDVPPFFGSRSTYTMGALGGHEGRPLRQGDRLTLGEEQATARRRGASRNRPTPSTRVSGRSRRPGGPQATPTT
jgi:allophanate hydrolase subunit 2